MNPNIITPESTSSSASLGTLSTAPFILSGLQLGHTALPDIALYIVKYQLKCTFPQLMSFEGPPRGTSFVEEFKKVIRIDKTTANFVWLDDKNADRFHPFGTFRLSVKMTCRFQNPHLSATSVDWIVFHTYQNSADLSFIPKLAATLPFRHWLIAEARQEQRYIQGERRPEATN